MQKRWRNDVGFGFLIAAVGALVLAIAFAFVQPLALIGLAIVAFGAAVALFGGFEFFLSQHQATRTAHEDPSP